MFKATRPRSAGLLLCGLCMAAAATGQATSPSLDLRLVAEIETPTGGAERAGTVLRPADRLVPGDQIVYTLEIRNVGTRPVSTPVIVQPVPEHVAYVAGSAAGPGADIAFSVDGGAVFGQPERLRVRDADGRWRPALAVDYTHIRWRLKGTLKPQSVAFVRFRARVK